MSLPDFAIIYLNRACPRRCPYCSAWRNKEVTMPPDKWKKAFEILRNLGVKFFLILGNEPLLLGDNLVELVRWWYRNDYYYGIYSTSPQPFFDKYKYDLLNAGLRNWSSGMDFVLPVYESLKETLTKDDRQFIEENVELKKKAIESLFGLQFMYNHNIQEINSTITISKFNIKLIPKSIEWLAENVIKDSRWKVGTNFVHYSDKDSLNDFAKSKEEIRRYIFTSKDIDLLEWLKSEMDRLCSKYPFLSVPPFYYSNYEAIIKQNLRLCDDKVARQIAVDSDGSLRLCGYVKGKLLSFMTVFDLEKPEGRKMYEDFYEKDLEMWCTGCYWSCPFIKKYGGIDILDFRSDYWKKKYEELKFRK